MSELLQVDDFAPDAEKVRKAVIDGGFTTERGPDGALYTGISKHPTPGWYELIAKAVGSPIIPRLSCFRLNLKGEMPHSWIHSDDICAKHASVLYLNAPVQCAGGTAFWRHEALGIDRLPTKEALAAEGKNPEAFYAMIEREWKDLTFWKNIGFVPMKFNRFITYPTCLFHSRFPFEGFGSGPKDGRLIWICFYDLEREV
jgi:hypothetical protein